MVIYNVRRQTTCYNIVNIVFVCFYTLSFPHYLYVAAGKCPGYVKVRTGKCPTPSRRKVPYSERAIQRTFGVDDSCNVKTVDGWMTRNSPRLRLFSSLLEYFEVLTANVAC